MDNIVATVLRRSSVREAKSLETLENEVQYNCMRSGVNQTSRLKGAMSASDPKRTLYLIRI